MPDRDASGTDRGSESERPTPPDAADLRDPAYSAEPPVRRGVLSLAFPALVVLAAEPLYLLVDTAVVGRLGVESLAALAIGGVVFAQIATQGNFLAYGTTGRAARRYGAGDRVGAVAEGVQASWLALGFGLGIAVLAQPLAGPVLRLIAGGASEVATDAADWLRIAVLGAPGILLSLAGNGWMRGIQDTRRPTRYVVFANVVSAILCPLLVYVADLGLIGSAIANVVAQVLGGTLFVRALVREGGSLRPDRAVLGAQLRVGRDLVVRTLLLQGSFIVASAVAARLGSAAVAGHQIAIQMWTFLALVLDSFAIAAQSLVGESLGAGRTAEATRTAWRVARYGLGAGIVIAGLLLAVLPVLPGLFSPDPEVVANAQLVWLWLALMQPAAGVVFALDGVLMGAGDVAYLRTITLASALVGFLPLTLLAIPLGWGLPGIWSGLTLFIGLRLVAVTWRVLDGRWRVVGEERRT